MTEDYTQEPWSINNWTQPDTSIAIGANGTPLIARVILRDVSINGQKANARRIIACVNACEGIPTEQLACDTPTFVRMLEERAALKEEIKALKQRPASELREMLRSMQEGEMTVSRGIELVEMWLAGNYSDDQLPPVSNTLGEDEWPMRVIARQLAALKLARSALMYEGYPCGNGCKCRACEAIAAIDKATA